jgi:hypothetical protein
MATRSTIALEFADGTVQQVYCHSDGYLAWNGAYLLKHYMDPFKVRDLIDLGDLSVLGKDIGTKINFEDRMEYVDGEMAQCRAYGRDRGDHGTSANKFKDFDDYANNHQYEEYEYILRTDGRWYVSHWNNTAYEVLTAELIAEE